MTYTGGSTFDRQAAKDFATRVVDEVGHSMYGLDDVVRLCLVSLYSEGHVLLEGNPGLGKTFLVKTLGQVLNLDSGRIQFTPDLMPTDILGTQIPSQTQDGRPLEFTFQPGPIFTNLLLADEINRATPKTQSALLEAMAERQVTVYGDMHPIIPKKLEKNDDYDPDGPMPFMVLATQNPIDHEGTYELPEAQSDRFMFKILMPVPDREVLAQIMEKDAGDLAGNQPGSSNNKTAKAKSQSIFRHFEASLEYYRTLRKAIRQVEPHPSVKSHIENLVLATNKRLDQTKKIHKVSDEKGLDELINRLEYGLGPRAGIALRRGVQAWTLFFTDLELANGSALAQVVIPALRHRIKLKYDAYDQYRGEHPSVPDNRLPDYYLRDLCLACAPANDGQTQLFKETLSSLFKRTAKDKRTSKEIGILAY